MSPTSPTTTRTSEFLYEKFHQSRSAVAWDAIMGTVTWKGTALMIENGLVQRIHSMSSEDF